MQNSKLSGNLTSAGKTGALSAVQDFCDDFSQGSSCDVSMLSWTIFSETLLFSDEEWHTGTTPETMSFKNTSALCGDLRFIVGMPEMCDVTFLVGPARVPVYGVKAILATRSRVFYELLLYHQKKRAKEYEKAKKKRSLSSKLKAIKKICTPSKSNRTPTKSKSHPPAQMVVDIDDFDPEIFRQILLFLHCGKVDLTIDSIVGVMNAADVYGIEDLRSGCFRFAEDLITLDTVLPLLSSTEGYTDFKWTKYLNEKIMVFISEKAQDVLRLQEFDKLSKRIAVLIFMSPELKATEEAKWEAAYRWTKRFCRRGDPNFFRRTLKIFTRRINLCDIPYSKLVNEIQPLSVVSQEDISRAIAHQSRPRFVIGQESSKTISTPRKPPRRRLPGCSMSDANSMNIGSVRRSPSISSEGSGSSGASGWDSGFSSSTDNCASL